MDGHDAQVGIAERAAGLDVVALLDQDRRRPRDAREGRDRGQRDGDHEIAHAGAEHRHDHQPHDERREGEQHVHRLHDHHVEAAADIAGNDADDAADQHRGEDRDRADDERQAGAPEQAGEDVAPEGIGAEPMRRRGTLQTRQDVLIERVVRRDDRSEQRERDDEQEGDEADPRRRVGVEGADELLQRVGGRARRARRHNRPAAHCRFTRGSMKP